MKRLDACEASPLGYATKQAPERGGVLYATKTAAWISAGGIMKRALLVPVEDKDWEPVQAEMTDGHVIEDGFGGDRFQRRERRLDETVPLKAELSVSHREKRRAVKQEAEQ